MRVAVTGVGGFVGGAVAARLTAAGAEVVGLGRREPGPPWLAAYVRWDLASGEPAPGVIARCDAVVHAAALVAPWGPDGPFTETAVGGTGRLLDAIAPTARFVVIGSASVYGPRRDTAAAVEPEAPVDTGRYHTAYARSKAAQERLVLARRPDAIVLRPRAVWGPGDPTLLPRVLARIRGGTLLLPAGGARPGSMTYLDSLLVAIDAALASRVAGPVNVADATPLPPGELLARLFATLGRPIRIVDVPAGVADAAAGVVEAAWWLARRRSEPAITRYAVDAIARPLVLDLARLHRELGVAPDADVGRAVATVAAAMRDGGHEDGEDDRSSSP